MSMNHARQLLARWEWLVSLNAERTAKLSSIVEHLRKELDAPDPPQIIRDVEELEALDPDALFLSNTGWSGVHRAWRMDPWNLPAVVLVSGDQVRAARKALEEETDG